MKYCWNTHHRDTLQERLSNAEQESHSEVPYINDLTRDLSWEIFSRALKIGKMVQESIEKAKSRAFRISIR